MKLRRLLALLLLTLASACATVPTGDPDRQRWQAHARSVTIARDDWGIAHVRGETDADAVFG
ncbi:MAG TPA: penicillin acylase family protein, partial [Allosphingosinicella sp.]